MKKGLINTSLYQARIKKGVTRKEAAKHLAISRLRLSLIEKGYLNVPNRRLYFFIHYYKLPEDFFETHSTFVEPLEKDKIDFKDLNKKAKKIAKRKVRIFSCVSIFTSLCCIAFGVYATNRRTLTPRIAWTETFTQFTEAVKSKGKRSASILEGDYIYKIEGNNQEEEMGGYYFKGANAVTVYEKDINSANTNIDSVINKFKKKSDPNPVESCNFYLFASNKKKVIYFTYINSEEAVTIPLAIIIINQDLSYKLRPSFQYTINGKYEIANEGSERYNKTVELLDERLPYAFIKIDKLLIENDLKYISANVLLNDIQKISRDRTLFSRLGISFIVVFSITCSLFVILLCVSLYSRYRIYHPVPKLSKETKDILNYEMPIREKVNDIRFPSFLPEFGLRTLGLSILFLSSFALFGSVYALFNGNFIGFTDMNSLKSFSSNFLSAAVLLLFFIKLDVYSRKNASQLLKNIITLFAAGLIFYIVEVLLFRTIIQNENIFSAILIAVADIVPGNVIWNIMLYSLIFYFLFTTPRKFLNDATKIIKFRLCSIIPTGILIFSLFYKFAIESKLGYNAIYISLMFHTSGIVTTLFAIFYLYSLYFFNLMNKFNYGVKDAEVYSYSRSYALQKNIIASVIIVILFAVDMFFRYNIPDNNLKLGKNWAIILLVPIILFYRPHIGKRNVTWDNIYIALYGTFFAGGYVAVALYILSKLNIGDLIYIRF